MNKFEDFLQSVMGLVNEACEFQSQGWSIVHPLLVELEDLRQEVILRLWKWWENGGRPDPRKPIILFIRRIATNQARTMGTLESSRNCRHHKAKIGLSERYNQMRIRLGDPTGTIEPVWDDRIDPGPAQLIEMEELIGNLTENEREFLSLLAHYSYREITEITGIPMWRVSVMSVNLLGKIRGLLRTENQQNQGLAESVSVLPGESEIPEPG